MATLNIKHLPDGLYRKLRARARRQRRLQLLDRDLVQILVEQDKPLPISDDQLIVRFLVGPAKFAGTLKHKLPTRCRRCFGTRSRALARANTLDEVSARAIGLRQKASQLIERRRLRVGRKHSREKQHCTQSIKHQRP